jgi:branched-chain amino acid aminotransferase
MLVYLNGEFMPAEQASIGVDDRGFMYGDGLFETMGVFGGRIFRGAAHLRRLAGGARALGIDLPETLPAIEARMLECVRRNDLTAGVLRLSLTRGPSGGLSRGRGLTTQGAGRSTILIAPYPPKRYPRQMLEVGARLHLAAQRRTSGAGAMTFAKNTSNLANVLAFREAEAVGADEAVILNQRACIAGCAAANLFLAKDGVIFTPSIDSGAVPGITRQAVIEGARAFGLLIEEADMPAQALFDADEIFYTNTTALVMPVGWVDNRELVAPGHFTTAMRITLLAMVEAEAGPFWGFAEEAPPEDLI